MMPAVSSRNDSSLPGRFRVVVRTWSAIVNPGASAQTGRPRSRGTLSTRCRYRGTRSSRDSIAAENLAREGAGPSNRRTEPT